MKDLLLYEPNSEREAKIVSQIDNHIVFEKAKSLDQLITSIEKYIFKIVILDLDSLRISAIVDILQRIRLNLPEAFVIGITALKTAQLVNKISFHRIFVMDYSDDVLYHIGILVKYFNEQEILVRENGNSARKYKYIGDSPAIKRILQQLDVVKNSDMHLLLTGETGSGKTELARYIHQESRRKNLPFMHINCAAIPENLLETELFGYEAGAFTGAATNKIGKFQAAGGGTICLDEIGEIPLHLQAKLLKVLDEKSFYPVGGIQPVKMNARIIAATNKDLFRAVQVKKFREDLYYRLNTFEIHVPALRERKEDIRILFDYLVEKYVTANDLAFPEIDEGVHQLLNQYEWYGNIRELQNVVESSMCYHPEKLTISHLPDFLVSSPEVKLVKAALELKPLDEIKSQYAKHVYEKSGNNMTRAARVLGVDVKTMRKLLLKSADDSDEPGELSD